MKWIEPENGGSGSTLNAENKSTENADPYAVDWSKIPECYNYVATDADGSCYAYDCTPTVDYQDADEWVYDSDYGEYVFICEAINNPYWGNSLRARPETEKANA